jgi:Fic family protein
MANWKDIETLVPVYKKTFEGMLDFGKFNNIAMSFHSTAIEGSTLTLAESELLLDKGLTPKGKPVIHQNMVLDHHAALLFTLEAAENKTPITVGFIQQVAGMVMKNTGAQHTTALGTYDVAKGDLRLHNVRAGDQYFVNYDKVKPMLDQLIQEIEVRIGQVNSLSDILQLSFRAHFDLVTIHPFGDGNGRTSRLMMNFIQQYHHLPIAPVHNEDRGEYIQSLMQSREEKSLEPFFDFMAAQYLKHLTAEIDKYHFQQKNLDRKNNQTDGYSMVF